MPIRAAPTPARLPPGPRGSKALQTLGWWTRPLSYLQSCRRRFGKRFTLRLVGVAPMVLLSDPEEVRALFAAPPDVLRPGEGGRIAAGLVGPNSVMQLDGDEHLERRRLILPSFHGEGLARLAALIEEVAEREVSKWPREGPIALHPLLQALTLEVILRTVFGLETGRRLTTLRRGLIEALDANAHLLSLLPPTRRGFAGLGPWERFKAAQARNDALIHDLIAERRQEGVARDDDVLSALLTARYEDGTGLSDAQLRDDLMTLLSGGHETTASALAWGFERLAQAPDVLGRLTDEIDRDGEAYLTATLQEILRCHPVIPCIPRMVVRETRVGDWTYPPGVMVSPEPYLVHHDPAIYPDPYVFRPERFLEQQPGTYTWLPFGGGRRRCIGASFAMLEMKIVIRVALRALQVRRVDGPPDRVGRRSAMFVPRHGASVVLGRRLPAPQS